MPLTDDQRAMLQLLLQRGQSYEDIGSLLGLDVDQVRSRARAALTEIGGEDPDREVSLTDYLLGQADPIGRADAARQLGSDPGARDLAERLATQLRVLAPGAELPELPGAGSRAARPKQPPAPESTPTRAPAAEAAPETPAETETPAEKQGGGLAATVSRNRTQVFAGLAGAGILIVVAVLALAGVFGGGDGDKSSAASGDSTQQASNNASGLTRATLTPQNGGNAEGVAVFARLRNQPVLQINVTSLPPSGNGEAYVIWLYGGPSQAYPLVRQKVTGNGQLRGAAPVPNQLIQALQQGIFDSIDVSLAPDSDVNAALSQARKSQKLPHFVGQSVVRGTITGPGFPVNGSGGSGSSG
jgi:hypothetical protein